MPKPGDVVENPVTKDRLTFVAIDEDRMEMDFTMFPGGFIPSLHTHPNQTETFRIISGRPLFTVNGRQHEASPGEEIVVEPGTPHIFRNPTDEDAHLRIEFRPALRTAELFVTLGALARQGKLAKGGLPRNPFLGAIFAHEFRNEARAAGAMALANPLVGPAAAIGRRLGLRLPT
jgi:mannose-6-phosphate isomerase-like protein (cupin superfamily)